jgi:hypothetical protein
MDLGVERYIITAFVASDGEKLQAFCTTQSGWYRCNGVNGHRVDTLVEAQKENLLVVAFVWKKVVASPIIHQPLSSTSVRVSRPSSRRPPGKSNADPSGLTIINAPNEVNCTQPQHSDSLASNQAPKPSAKPSPPAQEHVEAAKKPKKKRKRIKKAKPPKLQLCTRI